jgi:hypothetical protein
MHARTALDLAMLQEHLLDRGGAFGIFWAMLAGSRFFQAEEPLWETCSPWQSKVMQDCWLGSAMN